MGKLVMGILGGFSGTVGTVVGSVNKNGDDIIRARSKRKRTSFSEGQVNQQSRFALVTQFMQPLNPLLRLGCSKAAGTAMTPYNYACKSALTNAVVGTAPDFTIDFGRVELSVGSLSKTASASATVADGVVQFVWEDNTQSSSGNATDAAVLVVYNVDAGEVGFADSGFTRSSKAGSVPVPYGMDGDRLLFYLFFQSATDQGVVSGSQYLGSATLQL